MNRAFQQYRTVQTTTASGIELVLMLYRGAIRFLNSAVAALEERDLERAHRALLRAQDIVRELRTTLDLQHGSDLAGELERLYVYLEERLVDANVTKDAAAANEVRALLQELAAAWESVQKSGVATTSTPLAPEAASG